MRNVLSAYSADLIMMVLSAAGLVLLIAAGEAMHRARWLSTDASRRFIHAGVGLFSAAVPFIFARPATACALAVIFVVVNLAALRKAWLPSMHGVERQSMGTVAFPLALVFAVVACWWSDPGRVFAIPTVFVILAFSDPLASIIGTRAGARRGEVGLGRKTAAGTAAFFSSALLLGLIILVWLRTLHLIEWRTDEVVLAALGLAAVTCTAEALGRGGWDNFFIVLSGAVFLVYFDEHPKARMLLLAAIAVGIGFAWLAWRLRFLDGRGAAAGGLLAASVIGLGGYGWAVPSFTFFILSSLLSRLGGKRKERIALRYEKGSTRDTGQVMANGGAGWAVLLAYAFWPHPALYWAFLGAFAAAAADTWATEVGALSSARPLLITTGEKAPPGTSGAVSAWGLIGALAGALVVWMAALPFPMDELSGAGSLLGGVAVVIGGLVASLLDSLLGATWQGQYLDPTTGDATERPASGTGAHVLVRGRRWVGNDVVNFVCTLCGAALALFVWALS